MPLEGSKLGYRYNKKQWLFEKVDIRIEPGEIVGLVGPSGCGKSTLGRLLAGYDEPLQGEVTLGGAPLPPSGYHPVQMVFQHPEKAVNPRWTMRKTLLEAGEPDPQLLAALGIGPAWLDRWPNELSGGELQRFCIARALGPGTRYLIADEMTAMLDAITQAQLWQAVRDRVTERRLGVLVISHERHLLHRLCSRLIEF
ncbi:ATP-binding cassette domain-containing protein [Paenibacillus sp. LMG 31456]|uniref:ATP-binding cassette domain-containing protein n=1 Tax=Paenibacillus foliorum TaxID=2654974 RepID=A0A972GRT3_9BACL|nr:ATP-binding cassette domain-containing protein [Paenibacillus foliorum]NOU95562.1 ATP-binding cassette domain-containing protein [Paenibacillus foliorum]